MSKELQRIIPPETFERWAQAEENAGWISAGGDKPLVVTEEAEGIDLSGIDEFFLALNKVSLPDSDPFCDALKPGLTAPGDKKALASIEDDFDDVVLEIRQCNVGDGEVCTSCE